VRIIVIGGMIIVAVILFRGLSNLTDDMQEIQQKKADQIEKILAN
jgi:predicted PurR-regulated permease PerM